MIGLPADTVGLGKGVCGITRGAEGDLVTVLSLVERRGAAIASKR